MKRLPREGWGEPFGQARSLWDGTLIDSCSTSKTYSEWDEEQDLIRILNASPEDLFAILRS